MDLEALRARLAATTTLRPRGSVKAVTGLSVRVLLPAARVGDVAVLHRRGAPLLGEIVGFDGPEVVIVPIGDVSGLAPDDPVESTGAPLEIGVGSALLGRVVDGLGRAIDDGPPLQGLASRVVDASPPAALKRPQVREPLATGVRVLDGLFTLGSGQRIGLFAGSGVGKSSLLGAMARGTDADVVVVALIGERGREVGEFLEVGLGPEGRARSVVVVATSDAAALERLRAAQTATAVAEHFRDAGKRVLLLLDSITRVARAQREVGLAAGEPPTRRGYPPSVFAMLPRLLERGGNAEHGSITAVYTVLVEGSDMDEPIADEVRGILDGHIVLSREIAGRGRYPAVDVVQSLSRVMDRVTTREHRDAAAAVRRLIVAYEEKRDLITLGAYEKGSDPLVDCAIAAAPEIDRFVAQPHDHREAFAGTLESLTRLSRRYRER